MYSQLEKEKNKNIMLGLLMTTCINNNINNNDLLTMLSILKIFYIIFIYPYIYIYGYDKCLCKSHTK